LGAFYVAALVKLFLLSPFPACDDDGPCELPRLQPTPCAGGFFTRGAHRPRTTFYSCRSRSTARSILHALSAPMKPWGGAPLLIIGSLCEPVPRNECPTPAHHRRL